MAETSNTIGFHVMHDIVVDTSSDDSKILSAGKDYHSTTNITKEQFQRNGEPATVKKIMAGKRPLVYVWLRERLSKLIREDVVDTVIPNSKIFTSANKSLTIDSKEEWDTFFIVTTVPKKSLAETRIVINGVIVGLRQHWITKLDGHNFIFGVSPAKDPRNMILRIIVSKAKNTHPTVISLHDKMYIIKETKITMIKTALLLDIIGISK